jgi:uncharacterized protein (DUF1684 family)
VRPWISLTVIAVLTAACTSGPSAPDDASYVESLSSERTLKDKQFLEAPDCNPRTEPNCSPVPQDKRKTVVPLRYFPVDPASNVPAVLKLAGDRPVFEMPTSTGTLRRMQLVGTLEFTFQGQPHSLGAFVENGEEIIDLFVPFADMTTGTETYAAGRYLDIHPTATGYYTIDFNRAYNPYCAYNATYECPFPPPSNRLKVPVRAGEKIPGA